MPTLSNDILRANTVCDFLINMGVDTQGVNVSSIEGLFCFKVDGTKDAKVFANELKAAIEDQEEVFFTSLSEIIDNEVLNATCMDETDREACSSLLNVLKKKQNGFNFAQDTGLLEISVPSERYTQFLNALNYKNLSFTQGKMTLDLKKYLLGIKQDIVHIKGFKDDETPLVILNSHKNFFFKTKQLHDGNTEVTSYFFVPKEATPPDYHFVLDVSTSMGRSLPALKNSAKALAKLLFEFQPLARVRLTEFSDGIRTKGWHNKDTLSALERDLNGLQVRGDTPLYETTLKFLKMIDTSSKHNNILLFTDGADTYSYASHKKDIQEMLETIDKKNAEKARNKFTVFNYNTLPDSVMTLVTNLFSSETIGTNTADFMSALADPETMKKWAAARDLFHTKVIVTNTLGESQEECHTITLDRSGQLAALPTKICKPGERLSITVTDSENKQIASSVKIIPEPVVAEPVVAVTYSNAESMGQWGILRAAKPDTTVLSQIQP